MPLLGPSQNYWRCPGPEDRRSCLRLTLYKTCRVSRGAHSSWHGGQQATAYPLDRTWKHDDIARRRASGFCEPRSTLQPSATPSRLNSRVLCVQAFTVMDGRRNDRSRPPTSAGTQAEDIESQGWAAIDCLQACVTVKSEGTDRLLDFADFAHAQQKRAKNTKASPFLSVTSGNVVFARLRSKNEPQTLWKCLQITYFVQHRIRISHCQWMRLLQSFARAI